MQSFQWEDALMLCRRQMLRLAASAAAIPILPRVARAETYPTRPVRIVVGFAAGSTTDILARLMSQWLSTRLGQQFVVENRPGAGGNVGAEVVVKANADGYTLLMVPPAVAANPALYEHLTFDFIRDTAPVAGVVRVPNVVEVNPSLEVKTLPELIAYAKANPGKLSYGSAGIGSTVHLATELFKSMAGVDLVHVPYKGAGPATTDLIGGQIQLMFNPAINVLPLAQSGKVRALAVSSATRSALVPDLQTVAESGLPGFEVVGWYGLAVPAGTEKAAVAKLNMETNRALAAVSLVAQLRQQGLEPVGGTSEEATARIKSDVAHWTKVIRDAGIKAQ
jgi:tripartite-type tricarboxylate transporter receptor subunit TctC